MAFWVLAKNDVKCRQLTSNDVQSQKSFDEIWLLKCIKRTILVLESENDERFSFLLISFHWRWVLSFINSFNSHFGRKEILEWLKDIKKIEFLDDRRIKAYCISPRVILILKNELLILSERGKVNVIAQLSKAEK